MKVILTEDVKKRGKKGDVLELANGYANFLIKSNKAIEANDDNVQKLNEQLAIEKANEEAHLKEMTLLKEEIEKVELRIKVKVGAEGKVYGSVSTKQIVTEFDKQFNIKLDKKKIVTEEVLNSIGTYNLDINLAKGIKAIIKVHLEE